MIDGKEESDKVPYRHFLFPLPAFVEFEFVFKMFKLKLCTFCITIKAAFRKEFLVHR